ncbi:MAG TPA: hypothetical protein VMJ32_18740, partial [Pirellulales bacterium]|nr:hypothetical protein [Pirellulales bacterium]
MKKRMMKKLTLLGFCGAACLFAFLVLSAEHAQAQSTTIADWTFETSHPTTAGPVSPEVGTGSASASGISGLNSPAGNGSSHSYSGNQFTPNTSYYQFSTSTTSFSSITVQWDQVSSTTGPQDFTFEYSTDNVTYTPFSNYKVLSNSSASPYFNPVWNGTTSSPIYTYSPNISTLSSLANQGTVYFRLVDADTTSVGGNGGVVATGGTDRVDNFIISGVTNPQYWDGSGSGTGGSNHGPNTTWSTTDANWNSASDGSTNPSVVFDPTKPAYFSGTHGTVSVVSTGVSTNAGMIFGTNGYVIAGGGVTSGTGLLTLNGSGVEVLSSTDTATVTAQVGGTGFAVNGQGTLVLDPTQNSTYGGTSHTAEAIAGILTLNSGTLSVPTVGALGTGITNFALNGGTLSISTGAASESITGSVTGSNGTISIPSIETLTLTGGTAQATGGANSPIITLSNSGKLVLAPNSSFATT